MSALVSRTLFATPVVRVRDVQCSACRGRHVGAAECDPISHIVIPYRGSFVRRVGSRVAHADVNQALFFNAAEEYRIDHLGEDIVQVGANTRGEPRRWTFSNITKDSFTWRGEASEDGGRTWRLNAEYFARRRS